MLFDSPVFWQSLLTALGGWCVAWFIHALFGVPRMIVQGMFQ